MRRASAPEHEPEREDAPPEPERAPPSHRLLAPQRAAGNQAVTRALLMRAPPPDPPAGVTLGADPLPTGATTADPDAARVAADPSLPGGWTDQGGKVTASGTVGGVDRILLDGLPGNQAQQDPQSGAPAHAPDLADTAGTGPAGTRGRAIALIPKAVKSGPAGEVAVLVHLHGIGRALRGRGDNPRDVEHYQIEQQLEGFVNSRPGARIVALLPIGIQTENDKGLHGVSFGRLDVDALIKAAFGRLGGELPAGSTPGDVMMSAHSGGGLPLAGMLASGTGLPARLRGVFLFEAVHGDLDAYVAFVIARMEQDLRALEATRAAGAPEPEIFAAQATYLDAGMRVVAFGGSPGYKERTLAIRTKILQWWQRNAARLSAAAGGRHEILDALWANYQAQAFPGSTHENALATAQNNLGRALATLPKTGALKPAPPAPAPPTPLPRPPAAKAAADAEAAGAAQPALARAIRSG